jgi:hypothetical protein
LRQEDGGMRVVWVMLAVAMVAHGASSAMAQPEIPPGQLVREVVFNELNDHARHGYWRYWVERRSPTGTLREEQVETVDGPIKRLTFKDNRPLSAEDQQQEQNRLQELVASPAEQARHLKQYDEDEERIGRILALLPDAFVYEYDGEENGTYRLRFRSNSNYTARTIEARIFHAMSGRLWVDARCKRLVRLEGRVEENVDFGFGILGRLYQGGWFRLERVQVSATDWKTASLEVHMNIRALLVKTFARETSEVRGGFVPVPAGMSLAQGMALLNQSQAQLEAESRSEGHASGASALMIQAPLAMRP